jgi:peroxiredoxin
LREKLDTIRDLNAELLSVDPHEVWSSRFLLKETGLSTDDLQFPLLIDPSLTVSATYGVAFQMRVHTETSNRPATFIIDKPGVLRYARRGKTFGDRPSPDQIVAELKKLDGKQEQRQR